MSGLQKGPLKEKLTLSPTVLPDMISCAPLKVLVRAVTSICCFNVNRWWIQYKSILLGLVPLCFAPSWITNESLVLKKQAFTIPLYSCWSERLWNSVVSVVLVLAGKLAPSKLDRCSHRDNPVFPWLGCSVFFPQPLTSMLHLSQPAPQLPPLTRHPNSCHLLSFFSLSLCYLSLFFVCLGRFGA